MATKKQHVVVRSYGAGVFAGFLVGKPVQSGPGRQRVTLNNSRRLWKWKAAAGVALSGVAASGVVAAESKIDTAVDGHVIDDVIEIIPTLPAAQGSLR